ncbi:MAG: vanadium-dependent haloperoxidase [Gemmatimonadota bacterium]|nr:vanadium-dependent haloperoxidase [Gemmatimonadota bacterium]
MRTRFLLTALIAGSTLQGCGYASATDRDRAPDAELLHKAVGQLTDVIVYDIFSPPQASRVYAYASIAAYETVRHGDSTYRSLAGQANGLTPVPAADSGVRYHLPLAGVHAFMTVGRALTFSRGRMDSLRTAMHQQFRRRGITGALFDSSVAYGDRVAQHILAWASEDHFPQTRGYPKFTVSSEPGRWIPTPPAYMDAVEPNWAKHRPFAMDSASQFRPKAPHRFDMTVGSQFYEQAKEVYNVSKQLTEGQRALVAFWDDNPYVMHVRGHAMYATKKATPGGHWMGIGGIAARKAGADLVRSAETYALTAIALADGFISCWDEKFRSNLVRPETVINAHIDEAWTPLLQTPPFPEYPSGHSVISNAAAEVLTSQFGDDFAFHDTMEVAYGLSARFFRSFREAAAEAAISRLYGGIHYRMAVEEGSVQGRRVGEHVVRRIRTQAESTVPATGSAARSVH